MASILNTAIVPTVRVLIVDDSAVARATLAQIIDEDARFTVSGALDGAMRAIDWLRNNFADVVLLDLEMPGINGLDALPRLLAASPGARVIVVSSAAADGAAVTLKALALGATDTLEKPSVHGYGRSFAHALVDCLLRLEWTKDDVAIGKSASTLLREPNGAPVGCLAIGSSTGGIHALGKFFECLKPEFRAPILITQHLPPPFMTFFADQIAQMSGRKTRVAEPGMAVAEDEVIVAHGHAHLSLSRRGRRTFVEWLEDDVASRCRPSVDPMFQAVARLYGRCGLGLVLSGMGRDGLVGSAALIEAGGNVMVQDERSSAVWGMPGSVASAGLACVVAPPEQLARLIGAGTIRA